MKPEVEKLCELLGVDEIKLARGVNHTTVSLRIGEKWMATRIAFDRLAEAKNMQAEIGNIVFDLARALKDSLNIAEARGPQLDELAANMGITRQPAQPAQQPEQRRPMNRFEAIAEELKKL